MHLNKKEQHCIDVLLESDAFRKEYDMSIEDVECLEVKMRENFQRFTEKEKIVINWMSGE